MSCVRKEMVYQPQPRMVLNDLKKHLISRLAAVAFDNQFSDTINRLQHEIETLNDANPMWHRSCYGTFTSKTNIQRLHDRRQSCSYGKASPCKPLTRNVVHHVNWGLCIFCQKRKREGTHQVMSKEVQHSICASADMDFKLKCRIGDNDLIAYEAHYHASCKNKALKSISSASLKDSDGSDALKRLVSILDQGFVEGKVYAMDDVLQMYNEFVSLDD